MNKEKALKILLLSFMAVVAILFFAFAIFFKNFFLSLFFSFLFATIVLLILEAYLRIQHNIDKKFKNIASKIEDKAGNIKYELLENAHEAENLEEKIFDKFEAAEKNNSDKLSVVKNDIEFELLNLKHASEETAEKILDSMDAIRLNDINNIKENQLNNKKYFDESIKAQGSDVKGCLDPMLNLMRGLSEIYTIEEQKKSVLKIAPDVLSQKTVLYVGARPSRSFFLEEFFKNGFHVAVLEIFKENVDYLRTCPYIDEIIEGDVRTFDFSKKFDVIFWWHGPEHIQESELERTLKRLESIANKMVVLGCPWGIYKQGEIYGNIYETHLSQYSEGYFEKLGYRVDYFGRRDLTDSNISAVKYVGK